MSDGFMDEVIRPEPPGGGRRGARRGDREERDRRRRQRRRRSTVAVVVSLGLLVGAGYVVAQVVMPMVDGFRDRSTQTEVTDYPGPGRDAVEVTIVSGATGGQMGQELHDAGVVASATAFSRAFTDNPDASRIQAGTYSLRLEMRAADAVTALLDSANRVQTRVTIPEGFREAQVLDRLSSVTGVPVDDFRAVMQDTAATGLPAEAGSSYEGWLFPSTYTFEPSATPTDMIARLVSQTVSVLDERGVPAESRQEVLIKASLVERESPDAEASPRMARAIENRLERGMALQIDAAVAYGLDKPGTDLTRADISPEATDNLYNTYAHTGLTPTPIASPGTASIDAVLNPEAGPWIFWVTINLDTGETLFSETYAEHQQGVAQLRQWEAEQRQGEG